MSLGLQDSFVLGIDLNILLVECIDGETSYRDVSGFDILSPCTPQKSTQEQPENGPQGNNDINEMQPTTLNAQATVNQSRELTDSNRQHIVQ